MGIQRTTHVISHFKGWAQLTNQEITNWTSNVVTQVLSG